MTSVRRLRDVFTRASTREAPEINPDFADQLEHRLRILAGGPVPKGGTGERSLRRPPWHAATAIAVAAAAVAAVVVTRSDFEPSRVRTLDEITTTIPSPESSTTSTTTSTTAPPTTTSTTAAPVVAITTTSMPAATTTTTTARPATTTTQPLPSTTTTSAPASTTTTTTTSTTVRPTTTTTTQPGQPPNLGMTCQITSSSSVTCRWAQSTSGDFLNYRVIRKTSTAETTILETADRTVQQAVDSSPLPGQTVQYGVLARDRTNRTIGQGGPVSITCC